VSQYQKGKTNLDFTEARDSEWQWHQLGHMQICTALPTYSHASTLHSVFTGQMPFLPPNQQRQSTEGNIYRQRDSKLTEQCNNRGRFKQTLLPLHTFAEMHFINN